MAPFFISQEDFNLFHTIDRELYAILVINLWRDPFESMQVMALWIWLERVGFDDIVSKMLSLPLLLINELADEALTCLNCINEEPFSTSSENTDIPLIQSLVVKEISLQFFYENKLIAAQGVAKVVNEVCIRALTDIMQLAVGRHIAINKADSQTIIPPNSDQFLDHTSFTHLGFVGDLVQLPAPGSEVPPDDRTMFVTFSKGYPVSEREVHEFFTRTYGGDCIELLYMQEVKPPQQSLFARIVFHSVSTIEAILNGRGKAKFTINGKHVWARKFVPKRPRSPP